VSSKEYKTLSAIFPVTLVGLLSSLILFESQFTSGYTFTPMTRNIEFAIYLGGAFALSIEACKAAGNNDATVISDQISSLVCGIAVLVLYIIGAIQINSSNGVQIFPMKYERLLQYKPFIYSSIIVWLDVFNGFVIARFNRSR